MASARLPALLAAMALSAGCYTGTATYVPRHYTSHFEAPTLLQASREAAETQGLEVIRANDAVVEAVSAVDRSGGWATREHWFLRVADHAVAVELRAEQRTDSGAWQSGAEVCDHYEYAREQAMARAIGHRARADSGAMRPLVATRTP